MPDERFRDRRQASRTACAAAGRASGTIDTTVGVEVGTTSFGVDSVPLEPEPIAAALTAWAGQDVDHVQLGLTSATRDSFRTVISAIARSRAAGG